MLLYVDGVAKNITLTAWDKDNNQWSCCFFGDLETSYQDGQDISKEEYDNIVSYWEEQVNDYNAGLPTEQFGGPNDHEDWEDRKELLLQYD